jgi:hypothetical protein
VDRGIVMSQAKPGTKHLEQNAERGLFARENFFERPLEERRAEFENKLAQLVAGRKAKGK